MAVYDEHKIKRGPKKGKMKPKAECTGRRWRVSYYNPLAGKNRERYFDKLKGPGGAEEFDARKKSENERGVFVDEKAGQVLFRSYWKIWLDNQILTDSTRESYKRIFRRHFEPYFGHLKMAAIVRTHVQGFVGRLEQNYAGSTVNTWYNVLSGVFKAAVLDKVIGSTPCVQITLPDKKSKDKWLPRPVQVAALIAFFEVRFQLAIMLAASCGLRFSEIMGLTVDDFDFENMKVKVRQQISRNKRVGWCFTKPKTKKSVRDVDMPAHVAKSAKAFIDDGMWRLFTLTDFTAEKAANAPVPVRTVKLMFTTEKGGRPIWRTDWTDKWRAAVKAAGDVLKDAPAKGFSCHSLRHYFVSLLIASGADVVEVQHAVGHADPTTTYNTYTHLWPERRDRKPYVDNAFAIAEAELAKLVAHAELDVAA